MLLQIQTNYGEKSWIPKRSENSENKIVTHPKKNDRMYQCKSFYDFLF